MILSLIAAYAKDSKGRLVIGKDNTIPWNSPQDLLRFKEYTMGNPIIMGRKTYESIGRALPGRKNIVVTRQNLDIPKVTVVHSMEEALAECAQAREVFIIGGQALYEWALDKVERMYLTSMDIRVEGDTFFPQFKDGYFKVIYKEVHPGESFQIMERHNRSSSCKKETTQVESSSKNTYHSSVFFDDVGFYGF